MSGTSASSASERLDAGARTLLGLLRPADASASPIGVRNLSAQVWDAALALALQHAVAPLLLRSLRRNGAYDQVPVTICARLEEQSRATALDNLRNYGQFRRVALALHARDIPVIALKGLHLAELVYRDISLRPMSDLDILVPASQVERAVAALLPLEYTPDNKVPSGYDVTLTHRRLDILLEVHWSLAAPGEPYTPPLEAIWRSAGRAKIGGAPALVMSPEFLLLHVCAHLSYHHTFAFGLRALCDIAEIASAYPEIDWALVAAEGQRHGWRRGVAAALRLARDHVGAAVPGEVLAAIGAETLDQELLADALEQLVTFSGIPHELQFAPNLMGLASATGLGKKVATLWRRIFLPRADLALIYGVPERSARIPFFYAIRLRDLVRRYAGSVRALGTGEPHLAATVARHTRLADWMAGG